MNYTPLNIYKLLVQYDKMEKQYNMKKINLTTYKKIKKYNRIYGKPCSNHAMSKFKVSKTTLHRIATSKTYAEYLRKTRVEKVVEPQKDQIAKVLDLHQGQLNGLLKAVIDLNTRIDTLEDKNEDNDSWFVKFIKKI